ncbi:MAG: phenylalanine--tRNA ligase subunit beta [Lachnospiraceae bacterium]|nr:phenylalanine--tRNA ligase subunit beta [Lachnospiraceae bacterium]
MFVSMNWIRDFVDLDGQDIEALIHRFTLSTAEVEGIEYKGRDIENVVVGEILTCEPHPDSDHLHVLTVDGGDAVYDVVCGAPNARAGIKTAFAKVGGRVGQMKIGSAKLRGVVSNGMCCSEKEIGISDDHSGIMELDPSLKNGTDIKDIFPIEDIVFEVDNKSLTNRPDLWGHYGMAREFAALTGQKFKELPVMENDYSGNDEVAVEIKNTDLCFRYTSVRIENITKKESLMQMKIRLYYCGTRAINLLADLTNYLMLELGQPMHAFDGKKIGKIVVDTPNSEFKFTTLDGQERDITTDTLMIYDNETPVAIAGIMGGLDSEITDNTDTLVLESANFDGVSVRKSASRLALRTDASARYEKTLDPEMTLLAVKRFMKLLFDVDKDAKIVSRITDVYVKKYPEVTVDFDKAFIDRYTGIDISVDRIKDTLISLGFETSNNGESFTVKVPSFRATKDVSMKADIVEEITRIYGYDNFEIKTTLSPLLPAKTSLLRKEENMIKDILVKAYAMNEIHTRVWQNPDELRDLGLKVTDNVRILGSAEDQGILRASMMQSFLPVISKNKNYKPSFGIFEIGRCVHGTKEDGTADEVRTLGIALYSKTESEKQLYFKAVELINTLIGQLKHAGVSYKKIETSYEWQHPKNTSEISVDGTKIGVINTVHPTTLLKIAKNASVVMIELLMDELLKIPHHDLQFNEPSKFPGIDYDLSLLINEGVRFENIEDCWKKEKILELKDVSVIDIYDKDSIRSVTLRFRFELDDRTLTSEEVQADIDRILSNLRKVNVELKL